MTNSTHSHRNFYQSCLLLKKFLPSPPTTRVFDQLVQQKVCFQLQEFWPITPTLTGILTNSIHAPRNSDQSHLILQEFWPVLTRESLTCSEWPQKAKTNKKTKQKLAAWSQLMNVVFILLTLKETLKSQNDIWCWISSHIPELSLLINMQRKLTRRYAISSLCCSLVHYSRCDKYSMAYYWNYMIKKCTGMMNEPSYLRYKIPNHHSMLRFSEEERYTPSLKQVGK